MSSSMEDAYGDADATLSLLFVVVVVVVGVFLVLLGDFVRLRIVFFLSWLMTCVSKKLATRCGIFFFWGPSSGDDQIVDTAIS